MSRIGDKLDQFDAQFEAWLEDDLVITNYEHIEQQQGDYEWDAPASDEKQKTADSPFPVKGQVDPADAFAETQPWGRDIDEDVIIFVDDDVTISDGEREDLPYPSDVTDASTGETYRIVAAHDEGNGQIRCAGSTAPGGE